MTYPQRVASAASMGPAVVRRKRQESSGLPIPRHLWPDAVKPDPLAWRDERFEWARHHEWPAGKIGFLAFFEETRDTYRNALGLK